MCLLQQGGGVEAAEEMWGMWVSLVPIILPFRPPTHDLCSPLGVSRIAYVTYISSHEHADRVIVRSRGNARSYLGN